MSYTPKQLFTAYVAQQSFDPMGFFFLTYRSNAVGAVLAWKNANENDTIELLSAVPGSNKRNVEIGLLGLILNYFKSKKSKKVYIEPFE